jgi:hypothetical protein
MRIKVVVGDLVRGIGDDQAQVVVRSGGQVTSCTIHTIHMEETRSVGFSV